MATCADRPGCKVVVHFFGGAGPTQKEVQRTIQVEVVVGRNPEDSLQVERVQLLKKPLQERKGCIDKIIMVGERSNNSYTVYHSSKTTLVS